MWSLEMCIAPKGEVHEEDGGSLERVSPPKTGSLERVRSKERPWAEAIVSITHTMI